MRSKQSHEPDDVTQDTATVEAPNEDNQHHSQENDKQYTSMANKEVKDLRQQLSQERDRSKEKDEAISRLTQQVKDHEATS